MVIKLPHLVVAVALAHCSRGIATPQAHGAAPPIRSSSAEPATLPADPPPLQPTTLAEPERLVAIGDLHGDLAATRAALRAARVVDDADRWTGGHAVVVQTGDVLDRGSDERAILDLLARLHDEAAHAGGGMHALNGNHELMNVAGDFRYVTPGGWADFEGQGGDRTRDGVARLPANMQARAAAFEVGGPFARRLATQNTVMVVGATVLVHGGLTVAHVDYGLERINREVRAWMLGRAELPALLQRDDSPVWLRDEAQHDDAETCAVVDAMRARLHVERLVVGHTPQPSGITSACEGHVWRIDTGMSHVYGGPIQVLEVQGATVHILGEPSHPLHGS